MFSLELPHQGNSNEYTQYTFFNIKKNENHYKLSQICNCRIFCDFLHISLISAIFSTDRLMDDLRYYVLFNSVTFISE